MLNKDGQAWKFRDRSPMFCKYTRFNLGHVPDTKEELLLSSCTSEDGPVCEINARVDKL